MVEVKSSNVCVCMFLTVALLVGTLPFFASPSLADFEWQVSGEGNCFQVTNSTYLNVTLCSTEVVNVTLESVPSVVSFTIEAVGNVTSTDITMSGFVPNEMYYRHEDGYVKESFVADENGNHSYTQDLSTNHHVFVAKESGTKYIKDAPNGEDCYLIGTWDGDTKTCTLTGNVNEMIVLDSYYLTLDGNGWSVSGYFSYGVYAKNKAGLTIKNINVKVYNYGIFLNGVFDSTLIGNTVTPLSSSGGTFGVYLYYGRYTLTENTITSNYYGINLYSASGTLTQNIITVTGVNGFGIYLRYSWGGLTGNKVTGGSEGIVLISSTGSLLTENTVTNTDDGGISLSDSSSSRLTGNAVTVNGLTGISVSSSTNVILTANTMNKGGIYISGSSSSHWNTHSIDITNKVGGKPVQYCKNTLGGTIPIGAGQVILASCSNMIVENQDISDVRDGILVFYGSGNTIRWNTVTSYVYSIYLSSSPNSMINGNIVTGDNRGIVLYNSASSTLTENTVTGHSYGIFIDDSASSTLTGNTVMGGNSGISLSSSASSTLTGNTITVTMNYGYGIRLYSSASSILIGNAITSSVHSTRGVYLSSSSSSTLTENIIIGNTYGIYISYSSGSMLTGNAVIGGTYGTYGFYLDYSSSSSMLTGNIVINTNFGIRSYYSTGNTIECNRIKDNQKGLSLLSSTSNTIFHNNFVSNTIQLDSYSTPNTWDNGAGEGNYWSDYTGLDDGSGGHTPGDGVGDTDLPHQDVDWYPLMNPWTDCPDVPHVFTLYSFTATSGVEGDAILFTAKAVDTIHDLTYSFDFDGDGTPDQTGTSNTASHIYADDFDGTAKVEVSDGESTLEATVHVTIPNVPPSVQIVSLRPQGESENVFPPASNVLATFEFNGDVTDSSGNGRDAILLGGEFVETEFGQGLHVTGWTSDPMGIDWSAYAGLLSHPYTIEIVLTPFFNYNFYKKIFGFDDANDNGWYYNWEWNFEAYPNPPIGQWQLLPERRHYLVMVSTNPNNIDFYYDGTLLGSTDASFTAPPTEAIFFRDDSVTSRSEQLEAIVEAVRISSTARSPMEIALIKQRLSSIPSVVPVGTEVLLKGTFTDPGTADTHTAEWTIGSVIVHGSVTEADGSGTVSDTYTFTNAGIYPITLEVTDDDGGVGMANTINGVVAMVVVFDTEPSITGGGWFDSPEGAFLWRPYATGKASFAFVAKYRKGSLIPTGETEFQFRVAGLSFHSESYDWLVCGGMKCKFKGQGTLLYGEWGGPWDREILVRFMITAIDGDLPGGDGKDMFRIKIWDLFVDGWVYYDNMRGLDEEAEPPEIGGGSIVIHKG